MGFIGRFDGDDETVFAVLPHSDLYRFAQTIGFDRKLGDLLTVVQCPTPLRSRRGPDPLSAPARRMHSDRVTILVMILVTIVTLG